MTLAQYYNPPDMSIWQGRSDAPDITYCFQLFSPYHLEFEAPNLPGHETFAIIGFACDEGIRRNQGRIGASQGPHAFRHALASLPIHRENIVLLDAGDIHCQNGDLESAQMVLADAIQLLLQQNITPIVIGGGHELAWGHFSGIHKQFPTASLGIINFDAHFDMRPLPSSHFGSSGTPFLQIAQYLESLNQTLQYHCIGIQTYSNMKQLFQTADRYHVHYTSAETVQTTHPNDLIKLLSPIIDAQSHLYISICLDVFASAFAPGVSAPQPLGILPWQMIPTLRVLAATKKVASYDLAELSPPFDVDGRTAKLAANLAAEIIHHHASMKDINLNENLTTRS